MVSRKGREGIRKENKCVNVYTSSFELQTRRSLTIPLHVIDQAMNHLDMNFLSPIGVLGIGGPDLYITLPGHEPAFFSG